VSGKVVLFFVFAVFTLVMAGLVFMRPLSSEWTLIFGSLSLLFPAVVVFFVGGILVAMTIMTGINGAPLVFFFMALSALLALAGSIVVLVAGSTAAGSAAAIA